MQPAPPKHGAGKLIFAGAAMAILLIWMDGASESLPLMILIAVAALVLFIGIRNAGQAPPPTPQERMEQEREDARKWMEKSVEEDGFRLVDENDEEI